MDQWKLIQMKGDLLEPKWELYHLESDPTESMDPSFVAEAAREGFRFLNAVVHVSDPVAFRQRHQAAYAQKKAHPNRVEVIVAFELQRWDDPDWV